jgi:hypothetical protein
MCYAAILSVFCCFGCQKEEILTSKPGEPLAPVTDLAHAINGSEATLTWELPATYAADVITPVSVMVRITVNGASGGTQVLPNAPERFTYPNYDPAKSYRFTVKVQGAVDTQDPARSKLRLSPGATIAF